MDSPLKEDRARAERHIAEARRIIARQHQIVADLDREGPDAKMARGLLRQIQNSLAAHIDHRDRIRATLGLGQYEM